MKWTKNWGTVSGGAELHMLNRAERTRKEIERMHKKKPTSVDLTAFKVHKMLNTTSQNDEV